MLDVTLKSLQARCVCIFCLRCQWKEEGLEQSVPEAEGVGVPAWGRGPRTALMAACDAVAAGRVSVCHCQLSSAELGSRGHPWNQLGQEAQGEHQKLWFGHWLHRLWSVSKCV